MARRRRPSRIAALVRRAAPAARPIIIRTAAVGRRAARRVSSGVSAGVRRVRSTRFVQNRAGISLKVAAAEAVVASLGGGTSYILDQAALASETKIDDGILFRLGVKTVAGGVIKWMFNGNRYAKGFADGMQGHSAGASLDEAAKRLRSKSGK